MNTSNVMLITLVVLLLFFIIIGGMLVQWNRTASMSDEERSKKSGNLGIALVVIGTVVLAALGGYKVYERKKMSN